LTGYLTVWVGVGIAAALLQWGLHQSALLSSAMGRVGPLLAGGLLITAGAFQFSHLKGLPEQVPLAAEFPDDRMARRHCGCPGHGYPPRCLLHRLLPGGERISRLTTGVALIGAGIAVPLVSSMT